MKKGWESLGRPKESYGTEGMDGTEYCYRRDESPWDVLSNSPQ